MYPDETIAMNRIVSCFTNCYGAAGVWTAVEQIGAAGLDHLELALRGHNLGGLVIPESAVITEKTDDATAQAFKDHLAKHKVQAQLAASSAGPTSAPARASGA